MKRNAFAVILAAASVFVLASARDAAACDCINPGPPCRAVPSAAAVFVGKVDRISATGVVTFTVERGVRGIGGSSAISMAPRGTNCDYTFTAGERYVVYAYRNQAGGLETSICSGTKPLAQARDDLAYFDELRRPAPGARVYGRVRHVDQDITTNQFVDYGPLPDRTVTLVGPGAPVETRTDRDGRFDLRGLAAGEYELRISIPDRFTPWGPLKVRLDHNRDCAAWDVSVRRR
jgi:hypothetical protein